MKVIWEFIIPRRLRFLRISGGYPRFPRNRLLLMKIIWEFNICRRLRLLRISAFSAKLILTDESQLIIYRPTPPAGIADIWRISAFSAKLSITYVTNFRINHPPPAAFADIRVFHEIESYWWKSFEDLSSAATCGFCGYPADIHVFRKINSYLCK